MATPQWTTPEGKTLYKAHVSKHHVIFERRGYKRPVELKFRQMGGLVLLLDSQAHADLHANVQPPPKPNDYLMADIYQHGRLSDYESQYDVFRQIVDYVGMVAMTSSNQQNTEDAEALHQNLVRQQSFIDLGRLQRADEPTRVGVLI